MAKVSWLRRCAQLVGILMLVSVILAVIFSEPRTFSNIAEAFWLILAAPFQPAWLLVRSTGPLRRTVLLFLFVVLPIMLLPAYAVRPTRMTRIMTGIGLILWACSGFLMLALRYID